MLSLRQGQNFLLNRHDFGVGQGQDVARLQLAALDCIGEMRVNSAALEPTHISDLLRRIALARQFERGDNRGGETTVARAFDHGQA